MARIRTLKPEAWADRKIGTLSLEARLLWVVLITMSDDYGAFEADPAAIFGFGYRHQHGHLQQIEGWLQELDDAGLIVRYESGDERYGLFPKWEDHQKVKNPGKSRLPRPDDGPTESRGRIYGDSTADLPHEWPAAENRENTGATETLPRVSPGSTASLPLGPRTTDLGPGISGGGTGASHNAFDALMSAGFDQLTVEQDAAGIRGVLAEFQPPADTDWFVVGQEIRRKREDGTIRSDRPSSALKFVMRGHKGLPRIGQPQGRRATATDARSDLTRRYAAQALGGLTGGQA